MPVWWEGVSIARNYRINERIRASEVLVIGPNGDQLGVMTTGEAIKAARESDLDLVEVAPNSAPPVCRMLDYGKFKYDQTKKERQARKAQKSSALREVRMRTRIGDHDMLRKTRQIIDFLNAGDKVKVSVLFRGREIAHPEIANNLLGKVARLLVDDARVETPPALERRMMSMVLVPTKKDGQGAPAKEPSKEKEPVDAKAENP
ncbi:MAG: translation initiation factor IF-3 [Dehalococcoidia bacterium]